MIAYKDGPRVRLVSRSGVDHTARFPGIAAAVAGLRAPQLILDRELPARVRAPCDPVAAAPRRQEAGAPPASIVSREGAAVG
jgi:ATP-dependent DNA ligase